MLLQPHWNTILPACITLIFTPADTNGVLILTFIVVVAAERFPLYWPDRITYNGVLGKKYKTFLVSFRRAYKGTLE